MGSNGFKVRRDLVGWTSTLLYTRIPATSSPPNGHPPSTHVLARKLYIPVVGIPSLESPDCGTILLGPAWLFSWDLLCLVFTMISPL
jgi:hypothetical protein